MSKSANLQLALLVDKQLQRTEIELAELRGKKSILEKMLMEYTGANEFIKNKLEVSDE